MKFQVTLPYITSERYNYQTRSYVPVVSRPNLPYSAEVVSEVEGKSVTISVNFGLLNTFPRVITPENVDAVPGIYETCECGAVRQRTDRHGKPVTDAWHLCKNCVTPGWSHVLQQGA